jgi:hypothetical protein
MQAQHQVQIQRVPVAEEMTFDREGSGGASPVMFCVCVVFVCF